jgi:hypothetical protein
MDGQPVWLASISRRRPNGRVLYVPEWSPSQRRDAEARLRRLLVGAGDESRERLFRMNVTLCLHRAASDAEVAAAPSWFLSARGCGLAGGPVEILGETVRGAASTKPCERPNRMQLERGNPHAWIPIDCGECRPCRARQHCDSATKADAVDRTSS